MALCKTSLTVQKSLAFFSSLPQTCWILILPFFMSQIRVSPPQISNTSLFANVVHRKMIRSPSSCTNIFLLFTLPGPQAERYLVIDVKLEAEVFFLYLKTQNALFSPRNKLFWSTAMSQTRSGPFTQASHSPEIGSAAKWWQQQCVIIPSSSLHFAWTVKWVGGERRSKYFCAGRGRKQTRKEIGHHGRKPHNTGAQAFGQPFGRPVELQ